MRDKQSPFEKMSGKRILKSAAISIACLIILPLVLFTGALAALSIPSVQQKAAATAARVLSEKTGIEASVGHFSVRPPLDILLEDVFASNGQGDTLVFLGLLDMRLGIDALPDSVSVRHLEMLNLTAHTGELIPSLEIDGKISRLEAGVKSLSLDRLTFPIYDAVLENSDITLKLAESNDTGEGSDSTTLVIDIRDIVLRNVKFNLEPTGLELYFTKARTSTLVDLAASCYTVRNIDVTDTDFSIGTLNIPFGRLHGDAVVDIRNSIITSDSLAAEVPALKAEAWLHNSSLDLAQMRVKTSGRGSYAGVPITLDADYDIDDEIYNATVNIGKTDIAPLLRKEDGELIVSGLVRAVGAGIDPSDPQMKAEVLVSLDTCRLDSLDVSGIELSAGLDSGTLSGNLHSPVHYCDSSFVTSMTLDSKFTISDFMGKYPGIDLSAKTEDVNLDFETRKGLCNAKLTMPGVSLTAGVPAHALEIPSLIPTFPENLHTLSGLDSLIAVLPLVDAQLKMRQDNPLRPFLLEKGLDLKELAVSLNSSETSRNLKVRLKTPRLSGKYRLPAMSASMAAEFGSGRMDATVEFDAFVKDGLMSIEGIDSGVDMDAVLSRRGDDLKLDGRVLLQGLEYGGRKIGDRTVEFDLRPETGATGRFVANAKLDEIPVELAREFAALPQELDIRGKVRARAVISGLPDKMSIFAGVMPLDVSATYLPYNVQMCLSDQEITMKDDQVTLNGLSIIGADSTAVVLDGGLNLKTMLLDISVKSDLFKPAKLPEGGPIPVYGTLLTTLDGNIIGPVDSLLADIDVTILPQTDITYPIDKKNKAQISPSGTAKVRFNPKTGLALGGQLDVPEGRIFFSPKMYPMMPFSIDKGSHIKFNGGIDRTILSISASQKAKATYKPVGEVSRIVDFVTGVKVGGTLGKLEIGFYLDAPKDNEIRKELSSLPEEDREGLAAVLLATGMYASQSNEAAQMEGYALTSIVQSRLNAASSNKLGGAVNLDFGMAKGKHGRGVETTDYTLNVSKSFLDDRLTVKLGTGVSDNAEVNKNSVSLINNLSAEYQLKKDRGLKVRLFSMKDYNNIVDGELVKSGAGILYNKTLYRQRDSLDRSLELEVEGNVVYRSNNQLGPDASVALSKQNLFGLGDVFTTKLNGAYYWALGKRQQNAPDIDDTYILGADFSLSFPYLQLGAQSHKYSGQTLYRLGYLRENISGDYGMHKFYSGVDYSFHQNKYITHSFSPARLSIVIADKASEHLASTLSITDLLKLFANDEFVPSLRYSFNYNNYRDKNRVVKTAVDIQLGESANIISAIAAACGNDFNARGKTLMGIIYDQFVKCHFELRNRFRLADRVEIATRALAGAVISYGNSVQAPLSEAYSIGGPNSLRAFMPRSIGPGGFHNGDYNSQIFHTGDMKLEMNAELRFPLFWKINGAVFVDAGNVWNQRSLEEYMSPEDLIAFKNALGFDEIIIGNFDARTFLNQIALGTGAGLRLDYESIVIRLDLGVAIHAPFNTGRTGYYNIPNFWRDGLRLNFGIGYPF